MVARSKTLLELVVKRGYERESLLELAVPTETGAVHDVWNALANKKPKTVPKRMRMPESVHFATRIKESLAFIRNPLADTEFRKVSRYAPMIQNVFDFSKKKTTHFLQISVRPYIPILIKKIVYHVSNDSFGLLPPRHISDNVFFLRILIKVQFEEIPGCFITPAYSQ